MAIMDTLTEKWNSAVESFKDSTTYQTLNNSYQQLSPEQQTYVRWGGIFASVVLLFYFIFAATQAASSVKEEYFQKQELLTLINQAGDEIRRLKGQNSSLATGGEMNWKLVLANAASSQGLQPEAVEITKESAGSSQSMIQETLIEAQVKGVFIRPLVQLLFQIEHNSPPMKLKGLQIEPGAEGVLNARLILSGFMPKPEKK